MNLYGLSNLYSSTVFSNNASVEYPTTGLSSLTWLGGGEAEVKLFSLEIQQGLSHLYYNRFFGTLGYRGVMYDDRGSRYAEGNPLGGQYRLAQSLLLRLGLVTSTVAVTALPVKLSVSLWMAWKISNMFDGKDNDFRFGPSFALEY
jgi:hypothetical protein